MDNSSNKSAPRHIRVHALLLGERINTSGLDHNGVVTTAPLSFRAGASGLAVFFRYGVAVLIGFAESEEVDALEVVNGRIFEPVAQVEDETTTIIVEPDLEELVTPTGAIQLRNADPEHLLVIADALAKSVALAWDERQLAAVFEAIEPFAAGLASNGRPPGGRKAILRLTGRALLVQHRLSDRVAVREKPDILWDRPALERLYSRLEDEYELIERAETLDRKLSAIATTASALVDLQDTARFLRLEVLVVLLIVAELTVGIIQLFGSWHVGPG
jgi:uncharacterized Rmd1/YagE family protein